MNKLFLIKNPEVFQGKESIQKLNNYFEGWYFKHSNGDYNISFIPGINIENGIRYSFIQVITNTYSCYISYDFNDFKYTYFPFSIQIGNNIFSDTAIHLDINDEKQNIKISGDLKYTNIRRIDKTICSPNVMGPFSYIPFMECNHAILSMNHNISGSLDINNENISFDNGNGYIEKDWGTSFPKSYTWCQANNFSNEKCSLFFSVADIPFKLLTFTGFICVFILDNKEYRFTTYNNSKLKKYEINQDFINIELAKDKYTLNIKCNNTKGLKLSAPVKGQMKKDILETINCDIAVGLKNGNNIIFSGTSGNSGLEIVK